MRFAVIVFPGSHCDLDCYKAAKATGQPVDYVWHTHTDLSQYDSIILPGGFSYGDYLRPGAIARFAPIMTAVAEAVQQGKRVLGICNGFQILLEAGVLPGAMRRNASLKFQCERVTLRVENARTPFTQLYRAGEKVTIPIAHSDGNYYCDPDTLAALEQNQQIVFRYVYENPNGSVGAIAGICNPEGNVLGMMPHPERAMSRLLGSDDGVRLFTALAQQGQESYEPVAPR